MKNFYRSLLVAAAVPAAFACLAASAATVAEAEPQDEALRPVRRGGVAGRPYWNDHSIMFLYPPAFGFPPVAGAAKYRYELLDAWHVASSFEAPTPNEDLSSVWTNLPVGYVTLRIAALDGKGRDIGTAGRRTFWRKAPFREGAYPKAKETYASCARRILAYQFGSDSFQYILKNGNMKPEKNSRYPSKQLAALIDAMVGYAKIDPSRAAGALKMARNAADDLLAMSEPATAKYPHFTPTYHPLKDRGYYEWPRRRQSMNCYPAAAGCAFLKLYGATKDAKYLAAARGIADTYLAFQGEDGTWPLMVDFDKGPQGRNRLIPLEAMSLLEGVYAEVREDRYRAAADRAFGYIERTLISTWNWEGQFEDTPPTAPYRNLTKHPACSTAIYLLKRYPNDPARLALARELLRFAEDQFVNWECPYPDGHAPDQKKLTGYYNHFWGQSRWITPSVNEQYGCYTPVDASAAKLIRTYLALYRAEGKATDLAKARALGDTATRCTDANGMESTWWNKDELTAGFWPNCMFAMAAALLELAEAQD